MLKYMTQLYSFFNLRDKSLGQRHAPAALPPGTIPGTTCAGSLEGPRGRGARAARDGCRENKTYGPHRRFLVSSILSVVISLYFYRTYFFVLNVLACYFVFTVQHTTQTSMHKAGFKPAIPASVRPQDHTSDPATTGIDDEPVATPTTPSWRWSRNMKNFLLAESNPASLSVSYVLKLYCC